MKNIFTLFAMTMIIAFSSQAAYYIVGSDPFGNWNPSAGVEMIAQSDGTYIYRATISGTIWFVFADNLDASWDVFNPTYRIGPLNGDETITVDQGWITTQKSGGDSGAYKFTGTGSEYKITFNPHIWKFKIEGDQGDTSIKTYTVAGTPASLFGTEWDPQNTDNDMTALGNGKYELRKYGCELGGEVAFKVVSNHDWGNAWPEENFICPVPESGIYDVVITFDTITNLPGVELTLLDIIPAIDEFEVDGVWYQALDGSTAMVIPRPDEEYYQGDVVIPEAVTYQNITFAVTVIDEGAFEDCYDLSSVVIGDAVEFIGENAFQGCTGLTSVTIGSGVTNIGAKAFNYCNALQMVTCRGTVPPVMASSNCFTNAAYSRAILKVPRPEIETYTATDYWYKFSHIEGWGYLGPGDVNGSGTIDMDDLTLMINIMLTDDLGGIDPSWADVTGNGIVSMNDLTELINLLLNQ